MNRYTSITFSAIFLVMTFFPCQVSAASITETKAAIGKGCVASGSNSTAMGYYTTASNTYSTAMGANTTASGRSSTAMGEETTAEGSYSTAMGHRTTASGRYSTATGFKSTASGENSTAVGYYTTASGENSTALGPHIRASGDYSAVIGKGWSNTALLINNIANSFMVGYMANPLDTTPEFVVKEGSVGIGTSNPKDDLHVVNHIRVGEDAAYPNIYGEIKHDGGGTGFVINANASGGWADLRFQTDGTTRVFIESGGNVGINTTSPDYKLEVAGNAAKASGGTTWINSSDGRLKDITGQYERGLDQIARLKPVTFFYKKGNPRGLPSDEENTGFVAQEVKDVFPEAISEGKDGYLDFNMHPVNVALVNAIKELKAENEVLKAENRVLRQDIEQIKTVLGL